MDWKSAALHIMMVERSGDWEQADKLLDELNVWLKNDADTDEVPHQLWHFIADWDIRKKDNVYAEFQYKSLEDDM
jgi:hypothetical protein